MSCSIRLGSRNAKGNYTELLLTYTEGVVAAYTKSDIAWRAEGGAVVVAAYIQLGTSWGGSGGEGLVCGEFALVRGLNTGGLFPCAPLRGRAGPCIR